MYSQALKILFVLLATASVSFANEGGGHGGGEAPKEGEGKAEKKEVKSAEDSYSVVQGRVQALEAKVHSSQEEIEKLITEKQHTSDPEKVNEIIRQILTMHKELEKNLKEYDQQRSLLKYRYPEKANAEKREYERIELKSVEDMESQMSVTSSVNKTLKKVRQQYGTPENETAKKENSHKKTPGKPAQPSLTDPVILKK
jgi:ribosomal protein S15P/S13E